MFGSFGNVIVWVLHRAAQEFDGVLAMRVVQIQCLTVYWSQDDAKKQSDRLTWLYSEFETRLKRNCEMTGELYPL